MPSGLWIPGGLLWRPSLPKKVGISVIPVVLTPPICIVYYIYIYIYIQYTSLMLMTHDLLLVTVPHASLGLRACRVALFGRAFTSCHVAYRI